MTTVREQAASFSFRSHLGRGGWAVAGQALTVVLTLAGTRVVTQVVDPGLYGTVNLLQNGVLLARNCFARLSSMRH